MFGAPQQAAVAPVQQIMQQMQPQTASTSWMADVQSNPYGNLKIKPSAHGPTLFSADPNVSTSQTHSGHDASPFRSILATDSSYRSSGGTFRARAAGSLSASRSRPLARDRGHVGQNSSMSINNSLNSSMRTARPAPSPNLSMSQTRGSDIKQSRENFTDMLERSLLNKEQLQLTSQIDTTRSPATNKENDHTQASNSKDERAADVSISGFGEVSRDIPTMHTPGINVSLLPFDQQYGGGGGHSGARAPGDETAAGVSNVSMEEEASRNDGKWEWVSDDMTSFKSDREPIGVVIPQNFTVRRTFNDGEYVEVRFLDSCDLALGQCEGEGGKSVALSVLKFLQMDSPTSVSLDSLKVRMAVQLRANALKKYMVAQTSRNAIREKFRHSLQQEGWNLKSFVYDDRGECLNMEYEPPLV